MWALMALALTAYAAAAFGPDLGLPFIGDDYVFLDRVLRSPFLDLWSRHNADFGWYRPWSRDFHFWAVSRLFGMNEDAFRVVATLLWVALLLLYGAIVGRVSSRRVGALAALGVASLALWSTPLLWISGSQDLWMLLFSMSSILLFISDARGLAILALAGALLSKETAAVVPLILVGYCWIVLRCRFREALVGTRYLWLTEVVWLLVHPTLLRQLTAPDRTIPEHVTHQLPTHLVWLRTALATANLDVVPRPHELDLQDLLRVTVPTVILVATGAWIAGSLASRDASMVMRKAPRTGGVPARANSLALTRWGLWWAAAGWLPLLLPAIGWHAYYGCLGALGAWIAIAAALAPRPRIAMAALLALGLLRGAHAETVSWDWGSEWYQKRAGHLLSAIHGELRRQHPSLRPHTRVYLGRVPNNIGLIAGQSSALRVWYRDTTLRADFYSAYRPRAANEPRGQDLFFRFDTVRVLVEIVPGPEDVETARRENPAWEADHEKLAMLFVRSGDPGRAAVEFEKLSFLSHRADALVFASACRIAAGDQGRADSLLEAAQARTRLSREAVDTWRRKLLARVPTAADRVP